MTSINISPMTVSYALVPGEIYEGYVTVTNPSTSTEDVTITAKAMPFSIVEDSTDYEMDFGTISDLTMITDWIDIPEPTRTISPGTHADIAYTISVPSDAHGGGQYAAINVGLSPSTYVGANTDVMEAISVSQLIYASVAGDIVSSGEVRENTIGLISFDQRITANSTISSTGNVHVSAQSKLEIYPLFSDANVFIDEERTGVKAVTILPGQTFALTNSWDGPMFGIYRVVHTVQVADAISTNAKYVLLCPIWAFIGFLALILLAVVGIVVRVGRRKRY